jgi:hypothetical protein
MSVNIVRTEFSNQATLPPPAESGGPLRHLLRRVLRWFGFIAPAPGPLSLFQHNMGAYRFETDDGRVSIVPVSMELVHDSEVGAEHLAREAAVRELSRT